MLPKWLGVAQNGLLPCDLVVRKYAPDGMLEDAKPGARAGALVPYLARSPW
ncbi:MAG: hypothetical protein R6X02_20155 [Enhygromyxa sp.]